MNKVLFESIIGITNQRDSDSMPRALLIALADVLPLKEVIMYKIIDSTPSMALKQLLKLERKSDWSKKDINQITDDQIDIQLNSYQKKCIDQVQVIVRKETPDVFSVMVPVFIDHKINMFLDIKGEEEITDAINIIENIIKIYSNHLAILNDSERDKLTGLFNRRTFDSKLNHMLVAQKKLNKLCQPDCNNSEKRNIVEGASAWLAMLDIDFFKRVNDEYGHVAGDEVLLRFSQKMVECFRYTDLLFRFGGEEFVIVLEPVSIDMAQAALERFRKSISNYQFPHVGKITISIGYAKITENDFPATILDYSDKALYYAKEHGRNNVCSYELLIENGDLEVAIESGSVDLF